MALGVLFLTPGLTGSAYTQDAPIAAPVEIQTQTPKTKPKVIVEEVPSLDNIYRVAAAKTPSGFPVPRYVSLKYGQVNGRRGPSRQHQISWRYQRRGLPLVVVAETEMWRKVRDINGDESWVRKPALSGERYVLAMGTISMHSKPRESAKITAVIEKDVLLKLIECGDHGWCRVKASNGLKGWAPRYDLWGAQPLN